MATNMFVTGIPNGTSLDVQRGTALFLVKSLVLSARKNEAEGYAFDHLRITQLSGCLGIERNEAEELCVKVIDGSTEEAVIDEYISQKQVLKEETTAFIKEKLAAMPR